MDQISQYLLFGFEGDLLITLGLDTSATPTPTPLTGDGLFECVGFEEAGFETNCTPGRFVEGGGGPTDDLRWKDWRWYEGQELRPNWYQYPEERRKLKRAIKRVVKQKQAEQKKLETPQFLDVPVSVEKIQGLQEHLNYLLGAYAQMMADLHAKQLEDEEEREFVELLLNDWI